MAYPIAVEDLIPHRDRMKLIDNILEITDNQAITQTVVSEHWPLVQNGVVDPLVLIELVAQTAAVQISGKSGKAKEGGGGMIAGIKNADFMTGGIAVRTVLTTTVMPLYSAENYTVLKGTVHAEDQTLGHVEIQVIRFEADSAPMP